MGLVRWCVCVAREGGFMSGEEKSSYFLFLLVLSVYRCLAGWNLLFVKSRIGRTYVSVWHRLVCLSIDSRIYRYPPGDSVHTM